MRKTATFLTATALISGCFAGVGELGAVAAPVNLTHNGSFESGVAPWKTWHLAYYYKTDNRVVKLSRIASGAPAPGGGKHAGRVTLISGQCNTKLYACFMGIQELGLAKVGEPTPNNCFVASAYVRAANASAVGKNAEVTIKESHGKQSTGIWEGGSVGLSKAWQKVTVGAMPLDQPNDTIGVSVEMFDPQAGSGFDVDRVALSHGPC